MMSNRTHFVSFSFAAGVGDASAVAERVSGQVERLVAEEMKKVTAALNGISEHTVKIDEVGGWVKLLFSIVVYIQCWAGGHGLELECSTTLDILGQLEVWQNSQCQLDPRHDHLPYPVFAYDWEETCGNVALPIIYHHYDYDILNIRCSRQYFSQMTQRLGKVEKTTKDHRQASLQLAALLKEIEKTVKATQAMQASNAAFQNDLWVTSD